MIFDRLADAGARYAGLHPGLSRAFGFLASADLGRLGEEQIIIDAERLYANPALTPARLRAEAPLENHRRYIDVHCLIEGAEEIGWRPADTCSLVRTPYDGGRDCEFFADEPWTWTLLRPGDILAVWPGEAHATLVGAGLVRKVVVKVLV